MKATKSPIHAVTKWLRRQPPKMKLFLAILSGIAALVFLRMIVHDHDNLFVAAEFVHALGVALLIYKLAQEKTCAGKYVSTTFLFEIYHKNIQIIIMLSCACCVVPNNHVCNTF